MFNKKTLVSCDNITYKVGSNIILEDISFNVNCGDIITIIGPNGGGKTTLAKIMGGVIYVIIVITYLAGDIRRGVAWCSIRDDDTMMFLC